MDDDDATMTMDVRQPKCQGRPINFCARQSSTSDNFSTCNVIVSRYKMTISLLISILSIKSFLILLF